jgi:tetratricopeptide (TPR) repeat protein
VIEQARELWRSLDNQVMLADSFGSEAEARFNAGEFDFSVERSRQALQITEKIHNLWGQSYDQMLISFVCFERGELGPGIQLAEQSIQLADQAGLIASGIGLRAELAWIYSYCGALERGLAVLERAFQVAELKQPAWKAFPQAAKIRMYLLQGEVGLALQAAGDALLEPISIPYARYTIFLSLANIELAVAEGNFQLALTLAENLLSEVFPLTRVDIPDVLRWKAKALQGLGRNEEALQVLTDARASAAGFGCNLHLWPILGELADLHEKAGNQGEAAAIRREAHVIVLQIAQSLRGVGLHDSFLNQSRVSKLLQ